MSFLVRPWRYSLAPAAGEPYGGHIRSTPRVLSHFMCTHGPQAYEEPLPAPISCRKSSFKWAVRFMLRKINYFGTYSSSSKIYGQSGNARNIFDLIPNQQQAKLVAVPGSKRSNAFWGELRHPLREPPPRPRIFCEHSKKQKQTLKNRVCC